LLNSPQEPEDGWRPPWERGLIAAVVLVSGVVAALVGVITASWAQRRRLLSTVMVRVGRQEGRGVGANS
jgi:hypothetical protein